MVNHLLGVISVTNLVLDLKGAISRGLFPKEFLQSDLETSEWIAKENSKYAEEELALSGGFTMFCGVLKRNKASVSRTSDEFPGIEPFQLLTNRGKTLGVKIFDMNSTAEVDGKDTPSINGKTIAISNTPVTEPWPKVGLGIKALESVITKAVENNASEPELIESLIQVINNDTYPVSDDRKQAFENLRHSVFIPPQPVNLPAATKSTNGIKEEVTATPPIDKPCSDKPQEVAEDITTGVYYGTRTNTIILVSKTGHVKYIERSLHTSDTPVEEDGIQESVFEFEIEDF